MDKIEKALRMFPLRDRVRIEEAIILLLARKTETLQLSKLQGYDCIFRIRVGRYRIIYYDDGTNIIIKAIKRRNESTYRAV